MRVDELRSLKDAEAEYISIEAIKNENKELKYLLEHYKNIIDTLTKTNVSNATVTPAIVLPEPEREKSCFNCNFRLKNKCLKDNIPSDYDVNLKTFKCDWFES